jgi:hypothetical protein
MKNIKDPALLLPMINDLKGIPKGKCIDVEDLALFLEKKTDKVKSENIANHLAKCERCYEAFIVASEIYNSEQKPILLNFPVRAIAATILVFFFSVYLFFRLNIKSPEMLENHSPGKTISREYSEEKKLKAPVVEIYKSSPSPKKEFKKDLSKKIKLISQEDIVKRGDNGSESLNSADNIKKIEKEGNYIKEKRENTIGSGSLNINYKTTSQSNEKGVIKRKPLIRTRKKSRLFKLRTSYLPVMIIPEIIKTVDLKLEGFRIIPGRVSAILEIGTDGCVKNIIFINVEKNIEHLIRGSLNKWIFKVSGVKKYRFKLFAEYDSLGKWNIKKISGRKTDNSSDK